MPASTENYAHDADGNLTSDDRWTYSWDGENRLVQMLRDTDTPSGARQKLVFEYDHQGRRIRKQFFTYSGGWQEQTDTIFLYNDWNLVAELNANSSNARVRTYVWGTDLSAGQAGLSGSMQGAGGVGGLLKLTYHGTTTTNAFVAYDGNGNVMALVDATNGATKARYEYGPFAEPIRVAGPLAKLNPVRFSTKYTDNESGFLYYGYRYYNPSTGRWLSRDPIGESGGENIYAAFANNALSFFDWLGLDTILIFTGDPRSPEGGEVPFTAAASAKKAELSGKGDAVLLLDVRSWSQVQSALQKNKCIRAIYFYVHHSPGIMHLDMEGEGEETNVSLWGGDLKRRVEGGYHTFHTSSAWKWDKSNTIKGGELYVYGCHSKSLAQPLGLWFFANGGYGISTTCYFPVVDGKTTPVNWWKYLWLVTTGKVKADGDHDDNPDADDKTTPPKKPGPPKKPTPPTPGSPKTGYGPMVTTVDMDGVSGGF
jgi:RHS repeat-associated protein